MASIEKYTDDAVGRVLSHHERSLQNSSNTDIDPARFSENFRLHPHRGISDRSYYRQLLDDCYIYGRRDVKTMGEVIVTEPDGLSRDLEHEFFGSLYEALNDFTCGEDCCVSARVHGDEAGERPHLHYCFVPRVPDTNQKHSQDYKICMNDVLTRKSYYELHSFLQERVGDRYGVNLHSGVTKAQGGSRTVAQLKQEREREQVRSVSRGRWG